MCEGGTRSVDESSGAALVRRTRGASPVWPAIADARDGQWITHTDSAAAAAHSATQTAKHFDLPLSTLTIATMTPCVMGSATLPSAGEHRDAASASLRAATATRCCCCLCLCRCSRRRRLRHACHRSSSSRGTGEQRRGCCCRPRCPRRCCSRPRRRRDSGAVSRRGRLLTGQSVTPVAHGESPAEGGAH